MVGPAVDFLLFEVLEEAFTTGITIRITSFVKRIAQHEENQVTAGRKRQYTGLLD